MGWRGRARGLDRLDTSVESLLVDSCGSVVVVSATLVIVICGFIKLSPLDTNNNEDKIVE